MPAFRMHGVPFAVLSVLAVSTTACPSAATISPVQTIGGQAPSTRDQGFNHDWRFYRGDAEEDPAPREGIAAFLLQAMTPEEKPDAWRPVVLPHDSGVEDLDPKEDPDAIGPFSKASYGRDVAHTVGGVGWYRKAFTTERQRPDDRVLLRFDGVWTHSVVYVNGVAIGSNDNAYTHLKLK